MNHIAEFVKARRKQLDLTQEEFADKTGNIEKTLVNILTLPGFIIFKLTTWSDRPEERGNDLGDILSIISSYYNFNWT